MPSGTVRQQRRWVLPEPVKGEPWGELHPDPLVAEILWRRGVRDGKAAAAFLDSSPQPPPDVSALPNFAAAVDRVARAITGREWVGVFGDYDADGTCAAAILTLFLRRALGDDRCVDVLLPTREVGYGLNAEALRQLVPAELLIVADTGSTDHEHIVRAVNGAQDVVILDHHQIDHETGAPAGAITVSAYLEPATEPRSPLRDLTGAGLSWLLVSAVAARTGDEELIAFAASLQDLAAIGTVADVASLPGINRALVRDGLRRIRKRPRPGVAALCGAAGVEPRTITARDLAMRLSPRLNAAGRVGAPERALDLLLATSPPEAERLAVEIEALNNRRKAEMGRVEAEAEARLAEHREAGGAMVLVAHDAGWPAGIIGPVANRLAEAHGKPVVLLEDGANGESKGSARSVAGFDIAGALREATRSLDGAHSGGHTMAAGLTLRTADIPALARALDAAIEDAYLRSAEAEPGLASLPLDAELPTERLTIETARELAALGPFGQGHEPPLFYLPGAAIHSRTTFGRDPARKHLKLLVRGPGKRTVEVIVWGGGDRLIEAANADRLDLAVRLGVNTWNGTTKLEAIAEDFRLPR